MKARMVTVPELAMIGATRAAAGAGLALLLGDWLERDQRRAVGWTLLAMGVISTIPLVAQVMFRDERSQAPRLEGAPKGSGAGTEITFEAR